VVDSVRAIFFERASTRFRGGWVGGFRAGPERETGRGSEGGQVALDRTRGRETNLLFVLRGLGNWGWVGAGVRGWALGGGLAGSG
jgi:hypothetical protein